MKKKYLLYIHHPNFAEEKQKSDLVNLLLDRHYQFYKPGTLIETIADEQLDESVVGNRELAELLKPPVVDPKQIVPIPLQERFEGLCEHFAGKKMCRKKGCKNYQFK